MTGLSQLDTIAEDLSLSHSPVDSRRYNVHGIRIDCFSNEKNILENLDLDFRCFSCSAQDNLKVFSQIFIYKVPSTSYAVLRSQTQSLDSSHNLFFRQSTTGHNMYIWDQKKRIFIIGPYVNLYYWKDVRPFFKDLVELSFEPDYGAVLHAAGVTLDEKGIIICGPKGVGKTTIAIGLIREGAKFLANDMLPVKIIDGQLVGYSFPYRLNISVDTLRYFPELRKLMPTKIKRSKIKLGLADIYGDNVVADKSEVKIIIFPRIEQKTKTIRVEKLLWNDFKQRFLNSVHRENFLQLSELTEKQFKANLKKGLARVAKYVKGFEICSYENINELISRIITLVKD